MTKQCSKCRRPAITFVRYNGTHLCRDHFNQYVEKRVKKDLHKQGKTEDNTTIGIALSGGKDSTVALSLMHDVFSQRPQVHLVAITVDEGIAGYRDKSLIIARNVCRKLDIPHHVVTFSDVVGHTMDEIASLQDELGPCSYCGVFRRLCLNTEAKELGINRLVTGHNLDDMAQSILMNFINSDLQKLARLGPHSKVQPGLIPRLLPLRMIPEKETTLYAIVNSIEFYDGECPYAVSAFRGVFRDIIDDLEDKNPGTRHSIMNSYESLKELLLNKYPPVPLSSCTDCGEPTSQKRCKACLLKKRIQDMQSETIR